MEEAARCGRLPRRFCPVKTALLELDAGASFLQLRLDRVRLLLGGALLDGAGRAVDEVLRLLQAEAGDGADDLDHLDLLVARGREHDVERRLLLVGGGAVARGRSRAGRGGRHRSGGGAAPLLLDLRLELDELENGHAPETFENGIHRAGGHYASSSSSCAGSACAIGVSATSAVDRSPISSASAEVTGPP